MTSLLRLMTSDPDFDAQATQDLEAGAIELRDPAARARCLFSLSRRVTAQSVDGFFTLLDHEQSQAPTVFGSFPVYAAGTIALLVNSSGEVAQRARERWLELPFLERHDLRTMHGADLGIELPMTEAEQHGLDIAVQRVIELVGAGSWRAAPMNDGQTTFVDEPPPGMLAVVVGADGSALLVNAASRWDAQLAFSAGERSTAQEFANTRHIRER